MESLVCGIDEVGRLEGEAAVVIDVLRAFTVASWVYARGARSLQVAASDQDALRLKAAAGPAALTLKDGPPAPGFDLVNSPGLIAGLDLTGADVVQRTSNGTAGILAAQGFRQILCASLVNVTATALWLRRLAVGRVVVVVTGDNGTADEDLACADLVLAVARDEPIDVDRCRARVLHSPAADHLRAGLAAGYRGIHQDDLRLAAEVDRFDHVLSVLHSSGRVEIRPSAPTAE